MADGRVSKVTISLPVPLLEFADQLAREKSMSRSGVIAELLEREEEARIQALMAEGYREMAEENRHLAEEAWPQAAEMMLRTTQWDEPAGG